MMRSPILIMIIIFIVIGFQQTTSAELITVYVHNPISDNATQNLTNLLNRLTFVINTIAISILSILWIWEGLFLFFHKDDREGILKFKHDLPIMIISSLIILGASIIVNILSFIVHG